MKILVIILSILGVGVAIAHFYTPTYNSKFSDFPLTVMSHVVLGGIYLLYGAFQFSKEIRGRWINYHRIASRLLV